VRPGAYAMQPNPHTSGTARTRIPCSTICAVRAVEHQPPNAYMYPGRATMGGEDPRCLYPGRGPFVVSDGTFVYVGGGYEGSTSTTNTRTSLAPAPDQLFLS
jgi:hypothetical protein